MAALTTQQMSFAGITPAYGAAAAGGDTFTPDYDTFLHYKNTGGSPITVTVATPGTEKGGLATPDVVVSIPATTGDKMIGPFPAEFFADPAATPAGNAAITYAPNTTGLTVAVIKAPRPS